MYMRWVLRIVVYHFPSWLTAILNLCPIYFKMTWALAILLEHMYTKLENNQRKIKGGCQSGRKVAAHNSMSDLPLTRAPLKRCQRCMGLTWVMILLLCSDPHFHKCIEKSDSKIPRSLLNQIQCRKMHNSLVLSSIASSSPRASPLLCHLSSRYKNTWTYQENGTKSG